MRLSKQLEKVSAWEDSVSALETAQAETRQLVDLSSQLKYDVIVLSEQIATLQLEAQAERREASIGTRIDSLVAMNGRNYKDVEITSVTQAGLIINHSSGIARLVAADLSKEQQFEFGIDSEMSRNAIARESEKAVAYHRLIDQHAERTLAKKQKLDQQEQVANRSPSPSRVIAAAAPKSSNPLHQPARPVGLSSSSYRNWGSSRSYRYGSYYQPQRRTTYSYPGPTARFGIPGAGRRVNGTPAPTRPSPPSRPTPPRPCPND